MRFRALPGELGVVGAAVVEAVRWGGEEFEGAVPDWAREAVLKLGDPSEVAGSVKREGRYLRVGAATGDVLVAFPGNWLVRHEDGGLGVLSALIFAAGYEAVE